METKKKPYTVVGAVVAVLSLGIGGYMVFTAHLQDTDDAQVEADVVPLSARTGGQVIKVFVQENQAVKVGDVIMQLDEADQLARVRQAEAEVATAQAQAVASEAQVAVVEAAARGGLQSAKANLSGSSVAVNSAIANIVAARAGVLRAAAEVHRATFDLDRAKALRAVNAVTQERLEMAQVAFDSAQAQAAQADANLTAMQEAKNSAESHVVEARGKLGASTPIEAQIAAAHAAVDLAHATVQAASARLDLQRLQFAYLKVTSPVVGVISRLSAHEGQLLQSGQPVGELVPAATYIVANFKETQIGAMRPGQPVSIRLDAFPSKELHGKVESLSGGTGARFSLLPPDNASGNFVKVVQRIPVRIAWDPTPELLPLRAGMSADVTVDTKEGK
jgi:membrane fusion protein (multidrug efflux system)